MKKITIPIAVLFIIFASTQIHALENKSHETATQPMPMLLAQNEESDSEDKKKRAEEVREILGEMSERKLKREKEINELRIQLTRQKNIENIRSNQLKRERDKYQQYQRQLKDISENGRLRVQAEVEAIKRNLGSNIQAFKRQIQAIEIQRNALQTKVQSETTKRDDFKQRITNGQSIIPTLDQKIDFYKRYYYGFSRSYIKFKQYAEAYSIAIRREESKLAAQKLLTAAQVERVENLKKKLKEINAEVDRLKAKWGNSPTTIKGRIGGYIMDLSNAEQICTQMKARFPGYETDYNNKMKAWDDIINRN